ncbi:MAG TPA: DUF3667 domain-containing protein, partial [Chitinophagaceae bacterium]|nr:DUF3667 domain-containing protein [Chitinophagaceae bacterium]
MSHLKERKEKNCLNCNAEVLGRYCHICGQENVEVEESFWALATHLIYDITHFDSKFFDTVKYLLLKPGFLSKEYLRGRRASYLHPIRTYVFTSAIFFIVFFTFIVKPGEIEKNMNTLSYKKPALTEGNKSISEQIRVLQDSLKKTTDEKQRKKIKEEIYGLNIVSSYIPSSEEAEDSIKHNSNKSDMVVNFGNIPSTIQEYDSLQQKLRESERDNWLGKLLTYRVISINQKYKGNSERFKEDYLEKFKHSIPQMMFISLPLVALVMQLLYIRRRKQFFYVDHVILMIHVYIAIFISLLIYYGFDALHKATDFGLFGWITTLIGIYIFLYCFMAMYKFYRQGIFKTFVKY